VGLFSTGRVEELLQARRDVEDGRKTEADLAALARESTGAELDAAMREYGGYDRWGR
jgi:hypothetical protein